MPQAIIPAVSIGSSIFGGIMGGRKTGAQKQLEANTAAQSGLANQMSSFAREQHSMASPALQRAMQYYTQLAVGGRGAIGSALAPDKNRLLETYRGAERGMDSMVGPSRDNALAELQRQKAGQLGMMPFMARQNAMGQLGDMGNTLSRNALSAYGGAGNALQGAAEGLGMQDNMQARQRAAWTNMGGQIATVMGPWLLGKFGKGKGGGNAFGADGNYIGI